MDVRVGLWRKLSTEELMLLNCGGEDSWESLGLQGDPTSPFWRRSVLGVHWKDWCWSWNSNTLATWCEELTHLKRPWCWERLKAEGEGDEEDEMVGWHHWLSGHESEWTPGVGDGREAWRAAVHGVAKSQTRLSAWADCASSVSTWGKACASSCHVAQHILDISGQVSLPPSLPSLFLAFLRDLPFVCLFILFYFTMYSKPSNIVCTYLSLFLLTALFAIFFRFQGTIKEIV